MRWSRQFRALLKFAGLWAIPFAAIGAAIGVSDWISIGSRSLGAWLAIGVMSYGGLGLISGLNAGLLLARAERGRRVEDLSRARVALWSTLGGAAPAVLFAGLGLAAGAPRAVYLPLLGLGAVSAAVSGALAIGAVAAAKRGAISPAAVAPAASLGSGTDQP